MTTTTHIVVVDSIALKWVLNEPGSGLALILLGSWQSAGIQPAAPSWFACEIANVLYQHVQSRFLSIEDAREALVTALAPVTLIQEEPADAPRALDLAHQFGQRPTYDSQYAALAERLDCEPWTADVPF